MIGGRKKRNTAVRNQPFIKNKGVQQKILKVRGKRQEKRCRGGLWYLRSSEIREENPKKNGSPKRTGVGENHREAAIKKESLTNG